jgi:hypothetical protein
MEAQTNSEHVAFLIKILDPKTQSLKENSNTIVKICDMITKYEKSTNTDLDLLSLNNQMLTLSEMSQMIQKNCQFLDETESRTFALIVFVQEPWFQNILGSANVQKFLALSTEFISDIITPEQFLQQSATMIINRIKSFQL